MSRAFTIIDAAQRTPEWFAARLGRVTGSKASCVLMGEKTAGRADYVLQLALERLTGVAEEFGYISAEMQRGIDKEPLARMRAEAVGEFTLIRETGFISHNTLMIGASLDGDSDDFRRIWEFKCPKSTTHVKYLRSAGALLVQEYQAQMTHNAFVTGAQFVVGGSFDDRMPVGLEWVQREVRAADLPIAEYEKALMKFLADVDAMTAELQQMQLARAPASPITTIEEPMQTEIPAPAPEAAATPAPALQLELAPVASPLSTEDIAFDAEHGGRDLAPAEQAAVEAAGAENYARAHTPPSLRLGQISERLGFTVTADFMAKLGFAPAATDKAAKLYHEHDFKNICAALLRHIAAVSAAN